MTLIILGIIALVVGNVLKRSPTANGRFGGIVITVGIVLVILGALFSTFKTMC
jgi:hypothetical protein